MPQKDSKEDIKMESELLEIIWKLARTNNLEKFKLLFSNGLHAGIESSVQDKNFVHEMLFSAIDEGNAAKFERYFEKAIVGVDEYFAGGNEQVTFLQYLIEVDTQPENSQYSDNLKNITKYLLTRGASLSKKSYDIAGNELPSPLQLYKQSSENKQNRPSLIDFFSFFQFRSQNGKNIFVLIEEHLKSINQNVQLSQ